MADADAGIEQIEQRLLAFTAASQDGNTNCNPVTRETIGKVHRNPVGSAVAQPMNGDQNAAVQRAIRDWRVGSSWEFCQRSVQVAITLIKAGSLPHA